VLRDSRMDHWLALGSLHSSTPELSLVLQTPGEVPELWGMAHNSFHSTVAWLLAELQTLGVHDQDQKIICGTSSNSVQRLGACLGRGDSSISNSS
jgi:hypothetical protein